MTDVSDSADDDLAFFHNHTMLTGDTAPRPPRKKKRWHRLSYDVSSRRVENALIHEHAHDPVAQWGNPKPTSNSPAFNAEVAPYFETPRWARAYRFPFPVAIDPEDAQVYAFGHIIREASSFYAPPYQNTKRFRRFAAQSSRRKATTIPTGILLHSPRSFNYYHLMHDCITRIAMADDLGIPRDVPLIVTKDWIVSAIGRQFLKSDLFEGRKLYIHDDDTLLRCNALYMLQPQRNCPDLMQRVADSFPMQKPNVPTSDHLVVMRGIDLVHLRVNNDFAKLAHGLTQQGYQLIDPAAFSIPEQKWMFANAKHIVGENGAAFVNMIFCDPQKTRLDSLTVSKYATPTFQVLASALGINLHAHLLPSRNVGDQIHATIPRHIMDHFLGAKFQKTG